ncbi:MULTISPECIES: tripartite tricarboxylate transporter TctB family protein [unclassified Variovorax]|jgi:hypothetical protein|uniref:tripartite tricarboxylate transporter TctB family protein n=1 Tax=Variovorax TaxID=34072 RepID=UPI0008E6342F|nr:MULTISPECIES: tripartite tricarboxylate transporter TctB family protein [unclassified Variovorax]KAF1071781.1 MAG: hypothetical protein GAK39_01049 [Variovorax sp.]SFQ03012.1 Tripartite tricarboxylate transporter TctB family protein [Variovorax sp. PDC80]
MNDRNLGRGLFLIAISLLFGITAARNYPIGDFSRAGPGMFPFIVSVLLGLIGVATVIRSRFVARQPMELNLRNIGIVIGSLCGFALISEHINMVAGIVFMVFASTAAGLSYSWVRNVKISLGLIAMAFALQKLLGLNLPLL